MIVFACLSSQKGRTGKLAAIVLEPATRPVDMIPIRERVASDWTSRNSRLDCPCPHMHPPETRSSKLTS